jgi:Tfp pilus assembly protein PilN
MIQFNLLPDVKKEYIKTKRTKHLIITTSALSSAVVLVVLLLLFSFVQFSQKKSINDLSKDISTEIAKVTSVEGIDEILTIQNQLESLPGVNQSKPEVSRIIDYLKIVTPQGVFISSLDLNVANSTIELSGTAETLALINTYADTLKFATFKTIDVGDENNEKQSLVDNNDRTFSNVLTDLSRGSEKSSYTITLGYAPVIFDNTKVVTIVVPKDTVTTRSVTGQPKLDSNELLFDTPPENGTGAGE